MTKEEETQLTNYKAVIEDWIFPVYINPFKVDKLEHPIKPASLNSESLKSSNRKESVITKTLDLSRSNNSSIPHLGASVALTVSPEVADWQEASHPFIVQMVESLKNTTTEITAKKAYENEKVYYEKTHDLVLEGYDGFWRWLCEQIDNQIINLKAKHFELDYNAIVEYFGKYYKTELEKRDSFLETV